MSDLFKFTLLITLIFSPVFGILVAWLVGEKSWQVNIFKKTNNVKSKRSLITITSKTFVLLGMLITTLTSWYIFSEVVLTQKKAIVFNFFSQWTTELTVLNYNLSKWIDATDLIISPSIILDSFTGTMLIVITTVSFAVHIYSCDYMRHDPRLSVFMMLLSLFTTAMLILVTANNLVLLFIGWEGVGLCSYLLISFWYTRIAAVKAANKAMLINRVGDAALLIAIGLIFKFYQSAELNDIVLKALDKTYLSNEVFFGFSIDPIELLCFLFLIAAMGKSAQIGLHIWLPDAMEGPTPVSALIHAATMVTAGIFLVIRTAPLFDLAPNVLMLTAIVGALTAVFAGTCGLTQYDLKRIIAYSTCSQLGYMLACCGIGAYTFGLFHLFTHAFFKALLFLSAGAIIHSLGGEQDIRKMGRLYNFSILLFTIFTIGSLALMGFPFLAGFYSKDAILETAFISKNGQFVFYFGLLAAFFTTIYSTRLLWHCFLGNNVPQFWILKNMHSLNLVMAGPLFLLLIGAVFFGYLFKDVFLGLGGNIFWIVPTVENEFVPFEVKILPILIVLGGIAIIVQSVENSKNPVLYIETKFHWLNSSIYRFFNNKWYFDKIMLRGLSETVLVFSLSVCTQIWNAFICFFEGRILYSVLETLGQQTRNFHTGNAALMVRILILSIFLSIIFCDFFLL